MSVLKRTYCCYKCRRRRDYGTECGNSVRVPPISARRRPQMHDDVQDDGDCLCFECTDQRRFSMLIVDPMDPAFDSFT